VRLYEAPPARDPMRVAELSLLFEPPDANSYRPGQDVTFKAWWRAEEAVPRDYSVGLYLTAADNPAVVIANEDAGLAVDDTPTSLWTPGALLFERMQFTLPSHLGAGTYDLWLGLYYWEDPVLLPILADESWTVKTEPPMVWVGQVTVK
jgi:hypothetical protein